MAGSQGGEGGNGGEVREAGVGRRPHFRLIPSRYAGHEIESGVERKPGLEITVRMPDGRLQAITQPASEGEFYPGEPVRLLAAEDGTTHVTY